MSTIEQQYYRQQATMSTAHHTNGHHYGQRRASSNVVDQTVTQTALDYAHTQGQMCHQLPTHVMHLIIVIYTLYQAIIKHPLWSATLWT